MTSENELWEPAKDVKNFFPPDFWETMNDGPVVKPKINNNQSNSERNEEDKTAKKLSFFRRG
ncbi:hypothetical protein [Bifidobacterium sp. SO1]|uniref:hypothetical protein n=1 Tax=Bifidobacterium sp. SO1 TaxID=2809029 RepID=UPI001BDD4A94|nr:hypothetical protein [Bifidobacterium sp. SO1]MBT1160912.1 hypothetical protein [Bifidobacterium sp. SO1]